MSRHRLKQINRLAKVISFFTLLGVNIYLSCSYLKSIPESEYVSLFVLTDLWLHSNVIRIIAVIMLAATCLFCLGYICYTNSNPIAFDIFLLMQGCVCIYLMIAVVISLLIKKLLTRKDHS